VYWPLSKRFVVFQLSIPTFKLKGRICQGKNRDCQCISKRLTHGASRLVGDCRHKSFRSRLQGPLERPLRGAKPSPFGVIQRSWSHFQSNLPRSEAAATSLRVGLGCGSSKSSSRLTKNRVVNFENTDLDIIMKNRQTNRVDMHTHKALPREDSGEGGGSRWEGLKAGGEGQGEQVGTRQDDGSVSVYVMLPLDTVNSDGLFRYATASWFHSALRELKASGIYGVAVDVWVRNTRIE